MTKLIVVGLLIIICILAILILFKKLCVEIFDND